MKWFNVVAVDMAGVSSTSVTAKEIRLNPNEDSGCAPTHRPSALFRKYFCKYMKWFKSYDNVILSYKKHLSTILGAFLKI